MDEVLASSTDERRNDTSDTNDICDDTTVTAIVQSTDSDGMLENTGATTGAVTDALKCLDVDPAAKTGAAIDEHEQEIIVYRTKK